ncbi:FtsK/SpoIIIE domain-containing protein [Ornithinimicrobium cavernae]|uniref:FtsK/SpoIIIE domain-containing protein n=1 Tax=Ornithinimicrobium cavernae TaxID=2666047 RepID=UPI0012B18321|nr:FtsK/SpoIIIE domain-containing protein [Ornithinimicrobium cavernae]
MQLRLSIVEGHRVRTVSIRSPRGLIWPRVRQVLGLPPSSGQVVEYAGRTLPLRPDTVLGEPPLLHGVTIGPGGPAHRPEPATAPVILTVTGGPDAGGTHPLRPAGRVTVGRSRWCDLTVDDPALSRHHLTLRTTRRGIVVDDGGSTNGTHLGADLLLGPTVWTPGEALRAGASTFHLRPATVSLPRARPDGEGRLVVTPRSQAPPQLAAASFDTPARTVPTAPVPPGALGWLLPLAVSVLLALVLSMPALLLFGLMAPAMSLGSYLGERRRHRRERTAADAAHQQALTALRRSVHEAVDRDLRQREERLPDLGRLIENAQQRGPLLWSRAITPLLCRIGLAEQPVAVTVDGVVETTGHVPVEIDLARGLSLVGPVEEARAAARAVLLQVAVLHGPSELRIEVAGRGGDQPEQARGSRASTWDWLTWLPHATGPPRGGVTIRLHDLTEQTRPTDAVAASPGEAPPADAVGGSTPRAESSAGPTGEEPGAPPPRVVPITVCGTEAQAPQGTTVVDVRRSHLIVRAASGLVKGVPDLVSHHRAHRVARLLAPLTDGSADTGAGAVPTEVDLAALVPVPTSPDQLAGRWRREPRSTGFLLGQDATGPVALDLARDGPHALVAGTTGSGKSELLRTLVTSLSLVNRPDELIMVLVDYKGGSAFAEAGALPHVVGVITDLDPHLADRALTSLTAELKRRERVLAAAGVPDLTAYQQLSGAAPLPRLVLVIDEFRALAEELPGFLDGLVRIAALGRSLGVHLVLATQRPGGVVSADVRANVNLRIALRVRDGSDSYDVIDSPAAADLPEGVPGRALIRTGSSAPRTVQVASSSSAPASGQGVSEQISVVPVWDAWAEDVHETAPTGSTEAGSTLTRVIAAATEAARLVGAVPPASPWLPALPDLITLADLGAAAENQLSVPLLLTDLPAEQEQRVQHWRPLTDGHLGVAGASRSGRSTMVRTVLAGLLAHHPSDVHAYVFDPAGSCGPVAGAPHVGAVLAAADVARGCRVIDHLTELVASRQRDLARAGFTSLAEQRQHSDAPWPLVVLVIDGWPRFVELFGEVDRGRPLEQVLQLLREGLAVGLVAVLTGDRSLFSGRVSPLLNQLWSLRLTDPSDLLMAGLTRAQVPVRMPPGRVIRLRDGVVGQVAVVGPTTDGAAQVAALAGLAERVTCDLPTDRPTGPAVFRPLPRAVALEQLPPGGTEGLVIGVGGDRAEPVVVPAPPGGSGVLGILGPPGSGRSTALHTLASVAGARGWTVITVGPQHVRDTTVLGDELRSAGTDGTLVTVDGLAAVAGTAAEDTLLAWLDTAREEQAAPRVLALTGDTEDFGGFRGLGARVARERTGLVLQPTSPADGSPLGVTVPTGDEPLPGRGVLVLRGACRAVQVALPESF